MQAYALQKTLKNLGHEVKIINYIPEYMGNMQYKKYKLLPNNKKLPLTHRLKISFRLIYNFFVIANRIKEYEEFLENKLNLTVNLTKDELKSLDFDAYILGSDQIWNEDIIGGFDDAYFGEFANKNKSKIISYSASLGENKIKHEEEFKKLLKNLDSISVREKNSADFVGKYIDKNIVNTLDPAFLITKEEWEEEFSLTDNNKNYVLLFSIVKGNNGINYAKDVAKNKKSKLIVLGDYKRINKFNIEINTPYNFLNLIKNANCVITDSFHGVVFSIIFGKEFLVMKKGRFFRIKDLLDKLSIKGRIIGEDILPIDYNKVHEILKSEKNKSLNYLMGALKEEL